MSTRHPLVNITEWRRGCSCAPKEFPVKCEQCTEGLIKAVENWFAEQPTPPIQGARVLGGRLRERKLRYFDELLPQVLAIREYLSTTGLGTWGQAALPEALKLIKKHVPLPGATIELPCQPALKLADRVATAVCGDRQIEGYDVELLSQGHTGSRLSALIVEMAGYEAEAYALQDQVDEANSSVTALEQRIAELEAQNEKLSQDFASTVERMNEGCICGRAPAPKHPVDPRLLRK